MYAYCGNISTVSKATDNRNPARRVNAERGQHTRQETHPMPSDASIVGPAMEKGKTHHEHPSS